MQCNTGLERLPREYVFLIEGRKLSGSLQRDIIYLLCNSNEAAGEWAKLPLSRIAEMCGTDRGGASRAISDMVTRGIIEKRRADGMRNEYRLLPSGWEAAPPYTPNRVVS